MFWLSLFTLLLGISLTIGGFSQEQTATGCVGLVILCIGIFLTAYDATRRITKTGTPNNPPCNTAELKKYANDYFDESDKRDGPTIPVVVRTNTLLEISKNYYSDDIEQTFYKIFYHQLKKYRLQASDNEKNDIDLIIYEVVKKLY